MNTNTHLEKPLSDVDDYITAEMRKRKIPGLALGILRYGQPLKVQGYGLAVVEHSVPVRQDTVFELASITKQFTAAAIMLLVEAGKVELDQSITDILDHAPDKWKPITVRHLLTHTAGFPDVENDFKTLDEIGWLADYSTDRMYEAACQDPLGFLPGEKYRYSDVGYFLLGIIIQNVSGQPYREFMQTHIFETLHMQATRMIDQWEIVKNLARGYTLRNGELINIRRVSQIEVSAHFGMLSTVDDLSTWDAALYTETLLKKPSLQAIWTPVRLNDGKTYPYGFGWWVYEKRGHNVVAHGGITGTEIYRLSDHGITVIVLTNLGAWPGSTEVNSWGLARHIAGMMVPEVRRATPVNLPLSAAGRRRYLGIYKFEDGPSRRVYEEKNSLVLEGPFGPRHLLYQGNDVFEVTNEDLRIEFTKDKAIVTGLIATTEGSPAFQTKARRS